MTRVVQSAAPLEAVFVDRPNRFRVTARLPDGREVAAHCPNPGRMEELFRGGERVWLRPAARPGRVTDYDLLGVEYRGLPVSVDTRLPNAVAAAALAEGALPPLHGWRVVRAEYPYGDSRLDFQLAGPEGAPGLLEVKSCTLVIDGVAHFPDAPTLRGARHLRELTAARPAHRAVVLFVIQRSDARAWHPHRAMDPDFGAACDAAAAAGVELLAWNATFDGGALTLGRQVPVELE